MEETSQRLKIYNSRIIKSYLDLIKNKYPNLNIQGILDFSGISPFEVADQGHWFTQEQIDRFYQKILEATGNPNIAREAGAFSASPESSGIMRHYFLGLLGPAKAFEMIESGSKNFTRSAIYKSKRISSSKVEITVTPNPGIDEKVFQCQNRIGFFEAILHLFNCRIKKVQHHECVFTGGTSCKYTIEWENPLTYYINFTSKILFHCGVTTFFVLLIVLGFAKSLDFLIYFLPVYFAIKITSNNLSLKEIEKNIEYHKKSTDFLNDQININYNNATLANEIGQTISKQTSTEATIESVLQILQQRLDFDRGVILLSDTDKKTLRFCGGFGYSEETLDILLKSPFHLDNPESQGTFVVSYRNKKPIIVNDINEIGSTLSPRSLYLAKKLGVRSFICCPIISKEEAIGVLAVDRINFKRPLLQTDVSLLMGIATFIGICIHNTQLLENSERQFKSLLQVLAASTDARDFLTAGHSEKVTEFSLGICAEIGLPDDYRECIRIAALLHDYGKIAIPDSILKKHGRLTQEEYEIIKTHPEKSQKILEQISFERAYKAIPEIVGAHHEKIDGTGYPRGLTGREIPLGAKIIAVADFFEAITSRRHYRDPMPLEDAFSLLREGIGTHFERKFVEAFISYYLRTYSDQVEKDRESQLYQEQKRKRVPYRTPVSLRSEDRVFFGMSTNLSIKGIYVASEDPVSPESTLEVTFVLPEEKISALARVAWINTGPEKKKPSCPTGFGLEFIKIKASTTEKLINHINNLRETRNLEEMSAQLNLDIIN